MQAEISDLKDAVPAAGAAASRWAQYYALTKPKVVQLIVFCAFIGMVLAVPGAPGWQDWGRMLVACAGIWLVAAAAAAFNCLVERSIDARMKRTAWRPTARGELSHSQALLFSALLCAAGSAILLLAVNALTLWLTLATFIGYAVIYTLVLKPLTPQNIVIGGASGAMPPVLGWAAMTGQVGEVGGQHRGRTDQQHGQHLPATAARQLLLLCAALCGIGQAVDRKAQRFIPWAALRGGRGKSVGRVETRHRATPPRH